MSDKSIFLFSNHLFVLGNASVKIWNGLFGSASESASCTSDWSERTAHTLYLKMSKKEKRKGQ
jgi:hypothetical protein